MQKKYFRLGYTNPPGDGQQPRLHHSRDGAAFDELASELPFKGYRYGTFIHFYPNHCLTAEHFKFLKKGDMVVSATRPPLSDFLGDPEHNGEGKDWRYICPSKDDLEQAIFRDLERFFAHISRGCVKLQPEIAKLLPKGFEGMAQINFHTRGMGTINNFAMNIRGLDREIKPPKEYNAVGYFLHLPKITDYPCGLILSFSMGGYENLLWNRIVRLRFNKWLDRPVFGVALLNLPEEPEQPLTPELADGAQVKVVIEESLDKAETSDASSSKVEKLVVAAVPKTVSRKNQAAA